MGKEKYTNAVESLLKKSPVIDAASIERIVKNKQYTKQIIFNLIKQGRLKRLAKGKYTAQNDPSLSVFCFKPAYLGLQDALSFHGLWEQETISVVITTAKVRSGIRTILGANVLVKRIDKKYFFGVEYLKYSGEQYLPYSDIEKTFIDLVYFRQKINKKTLNELMKKIDRKKLGLYLKKYPGMIRKRVMNLIENRV